MRQRRCLRIKYKVSKTLGFKEPLDGYTEEEKLLEQLIAISTIQNIYRKLPTSRMKFIVAAHFELGYSQELLAEMLGITQPSLNEEITNIRRVLAGKPYRPHKQKVVIQPQDLINYLLLVSKP